MKKIVLFGGSFDPPHPGHFEMGDYLWKTLQADEVWFLFSRNWQKANQQYASTQHRINMGHILMQHFPGRPFVMSDIQDQIGTHITYEVLNSLKARHPDTKFVWAMGADSMAGFDTWDNYKEIIETTPVAVVDRPSWSEKARNKYRDIENLHQVGLTPKASDLFNVAANFHFLENPQIDLSSSHLLRQIAAGDNDFDPRFTEVAQYIKENGLYKPETPRIHNNL